MVSRGLAGISRQIEREETAFMIYDQLSPSISIDTSYGNFYLNFQMNTRQHIQRNGFSDITNRQNPGTGNPGLRREESYSVRMMNDSILTVMTESITGLSDTVETIISEEIIHLPDPGLIEEKLNDKKVLVEDVMSKMIRPPRHFNERLSPEILENYIDRFLMESYPGLDYEYAVVDRSNKARYKSDGFDPGKRNRVYTSRLFPGDIISNPNYLRIYFPGERGFIYQSIGFMSITSVLMIFIIIGIFIFTLWIIFRQKKLSEIKTDFVNNMTHELKTPISTISLASQMLNDSSIPLENKNLGHISRVIDTESKRLGVQVEKVLQMAIFDKGKIKLKKKVTDMNDLIEQAVDNFRIQLKKRGGTILWEPRAEHATVYIDQVHFTNVVSNLIDNGIKYSGENPEISVFTRCEQDHLIFSVEDKGIGISKEEQKRIFEKFYRVSTGNIHNVKGFGLGLSYVKKIVEIHEGEISIKSELNRGTRFDISLPLYKED